MRPKKKKAVPDTLTNKLFIDFQKLFRCMDFGRSLHGRNPVLTFRQMQVLSFFNESDTVHISEVSRKLNMSIQSVNNLVKRLEVMGYVERTQNEHDKRLSDIRFTAKGLAGFNMFRAEQLGFLSLLLQQLDAAERKAALEAVECAASLFQKAVMNASHKEAACAGG
ncbi:MAG: winged helix DNA-binding protein [Deltaproteobacteria bacterium]|nr:winged helix DNA-binding protein [Deltaproteobacteria bacterium]